MLSRVTNCRYLIPAAAVMRAEPGRAWSGGTGTPPGSAVPADTTTTADTVTADMTTTAESSTTAAPETATAPETTSTTTPGASSVGQEPGTARSVRTEADHEIDDHFRHIVCVLCYPEFEGTRRAPHDAVCICGKRLRAGDAPGPATAPQCILCNELVDHHFSVAHADDD